jgi:hypothetical protein
MDCKYFEDCSAPLCPKAEPEKAQWFPDEPVCRLADVPAWVKRQRKLARKGLPREAGYFTPAMLSHGCRWSGGTKGIDPDGTDKERTVALSTWFAKHPELKLKPMSESDKEKLASMGFKKRGISPCDGC